MQNSLPPRSRTRRWLLAIRPKTLGISLAPVLVGSALAYQEHGLWSWATLAVTLFSALTIQIGTNLYNDAADFERGTDNRQRIGPPRASAQGWFSVRVMKRAAGICFAAAFLAGVYLAWIGGWPIVAIGLASLLTGYAYTGGPRPIAYSGSGELFAFLFFGIIAVTGSYYLQAHTLSANVWPSAAAIGLLASAVLLVNNYRDLETDRAAGKLTLVHYLGRRWSTRLYALLLVAPFLLPVTLPQRASWAVVLLLPAAILLAHRFAAEPIGSGFNRILVATAQLQLSFALLFGAALLLVA